MFENFSQERRHRMGTSMAKKSLSLFISLVMVLSFAFPVAAFAAQPDVKVDNHTTTSTQKTISGITIDGVDAPKAGSALDDTAVVTTAEGETWEIPVLWISEKLQLATQAEEGVSYLPAIAYFVPQEYSVSGGTYTVRLSESLTKLFGSEDVISVYNETSGITYILPASLRDFFARIAADLKLTAGQNPFAEGALAEAEAAEELYDELYDEEAYDEDDDGEDDDEGDEGEEGEPEKTLVEIHCAQTARAAFTDEDLEWILDLIINKLEPQAVNLLLEKFPAFKAGAAQGLIGREISLYVYYQKGDQDGNPEHAGASSALAYVAKGVGKYDDGYKFTYMIGLDLDDLVKKGADGKPYVNPETGKFVLLRSGKTLETLENTIVHELFHAVMDDYNRTGMIGATNINDAIRNDQGGFVAPNGVELFIKTSYPKWFAEGTASAVENVYAFRYDVFDALYPTVLSKYPFTVQQRLNILLTNYVKGTYDNAPAFFALPYADYAENPATGFDPSNARYVSGYLAVAYLSTLATDADPNLKPALVKKEDGSAAFSADNMRMGLNSILERMHNGETLDQVIASISKVEGKSLYASTDDFAKKFVQGPEEEGGIFRGDLTSLFFVAQFLDYLHGIEVAENGFIPNGSILFEFDKNFKSPLDSSKDANSDFLTIIKENGFIPSTVPDEVALSGGGKSRTGTEVATATAASTASATATSASNSSADATFTATAGGNAAGVASNNDSSPSSSADTTAAAAKKPASADAAAGAANAGDAAAADAASTDAAAPEAAAGDQSGDASATDTVADDQAVNAPDADADNALPENDTTGDAPASAPDNSLPASNHDSDGAEKVDQAA